MSKGRYAPPPRQAQDTGVPVFTPGELAAFMASSAGLHHLEIRHDDGCPAIGTGRGCRCEPDVFLRAHDWRLIAEVKG